LFCPVLLTFLHLIWRTGSHVSVYVASRSCISLLFIASHLLQPISTRIIDRRPTKLDHGQADGLMTRTLELFESIGVLQDMEKELATLSEIRFWSPDPETGKLRRTSTIPQDRPGDSRFLVSILHQGRVEHHLNQSSLEHSNGQIAVERGVQPESLTIDEEAAKDPTAYPITLRLRRLVEANGYPKVKTNDLRTLPCV